MAFILHDRESVIVKGATLKLDDLKRIGDEIGLHDLCLEFDELLRTDTNLKRLSGTPAYRALDARLAEVFYIVRTMARTHLPGSPVFPYLELLGRAIEMKSAKLADQRHQSIVEARTRLRAHIERVEDLRLAACSSVERDRLAALVRTQGFTVSEMEVLRYKDGDNFGTTFVACREATGPPAPASAP